MAELPKANNLFQTDAPKTATQRWVRSQIFPRLAERGYSSEKNLKILHRASTWGIEGREERLLVAEVYDILEKNGLGYLSAKEKLAIASGQEHPLVRVVYPPSIRGRYRLRSRIIVSTPGGGVVKNDWASRAIHVKARGQDFAYDAPHLELDELMGRLCQGYDLLAEKIEDPESLAISLGYFYSIGKNLIHPFFDGNHRAFERFLEFEFYKRNLELDMPQDESSNIPLNDPIRTWVAEVMINFLRVNSLDLFSIDSRPSLEMREVYQKRLRASLLRTIEDRLDDPLFMYIYIGIAKEMLKWTRYDKTEFLEKLQSQLAKKSGLTVIHKK
jgi:hypothetical protein